MLTYLNAGEAGIRRIHLIEETGHIVSTLFDGEIQYWDYTRKEIVKVNQLLRRGYQESRRRSST